MDWKSIFLTDLLLEKTLYTKRKSIPGHVMTIHEDGKTTVKKMVGSQKKFKTNLK
jgi:hypothetical protein